MNSKISRFLSQSCFLRKSVYLRPYRRIFRLIFLILLGLMIILWIPVLSSQPVNSTPEAIAPLSESRSFLQRGIDHYELEEYEKAITIFQQAISQFEIQGDPLSQAFALQYLSLAYQHLGKWGEANQAIANSFNLLQDDPDPDNPTYLEIFAKTLNTQGQWQYAQGALAEAIETWKKAATYYAKANYTTGIVISQINQIQGLQGLGLNRQAEQELQKVYLLLQQEPDPRLRATGLRSLGKALRKLGILNRDIAQYLQPNADQQQQELFKGSLEILQESLAIAQQAQNPQDQVFAWLELGNTEQALADKFIAIGKSDAKYLQKAAFDYQQATEVAQVSNLSTLQLQAQLNHFGLLVKTGQGLVFPQDSTLASLLSQIQQQIDAFPSSRMAINAQLNFVQNLTCLKQILDHQNISCVSRDRQEFVKQKREQIQAEDIPIKTPTWPEISQMLATTIHLREKRDISN